MYLKVDSACLLIECFSTERFNIYWKSIVTTKSVSLLWYKAIYNVCTVSIVHNWSIYSFDSLSNLSSGQVYLINLYEWIMHFVYWSSLFNDLVLRFCQLCIKSSNIFCLLWMLKHLSAVTNDVYRICFCLLIINPMNLFYYEFEIKSVHCVFIIFWITVALLLLSFHSGF